MDLYDLFFSIDYFFPYVKKKNQEVQRGKCEEREKWRKTENNVENMLIL